MSKQLATLGYRVQEGVAQDLMERMSQYWGNIQVELCAGLFESQMLGVAELF